VVDDVIAWVEGKVKVEVVPRDKPPVQVVAPVTDNVPPMVSFPFTFDEVQTDVPFMFCVPFI
jgi:hypothetical protein